MRPLRAFTVLSLTIVLLAGGLLPASAADPWPTGTYRVVLSAERLAGTDRYSTAVTIAEDSFPGWSGIDHVIVASGENRALSDPLAAASLCWAYDAPLLLVNSSGVPAVVRTALEQMRSVNSTVSVTVVGGPVAVPSPVIAELEGIMGAGQVEQPWLNGDRYTLAAGIATRASEVASDTARPVPARALIANGTNAAAFVDALALSAVSAHTGVPILLVERDRVPAATASALASLPAGGVLVAGGPAVVSDATYSALGATARWAGDNRYATATQVATSARTVRWLTASTVGLASTVPDALTGATHIGRTGGALLHVLPDTLGPAAAGYLSRSAGVVTAARRYGGTSVLSAGLAGELTGAPTAPRVIAPTPGSRLGKKARVVVASGVNTTEFKVYSGTTLVATRSVPGYATVDFGILPTPADGSTYRIVARNPDARETAASATYRRHTYPASTSIVIDKSDFRLYWFKDDVFVKSYPIAIGKPSTPTPAALWRIDSRYYTDPLGVYGPRKMRLYRWNGSTFYYTGYGIHGTNEPWVIGTMASHGCIRLYNAEILDLFPRVPLGTLVQTRE